MTWFRKEAEMAWLKGFSPEVTETALDKVRGFLR
jgi:hypothetical protein